MEYARLCDVYARVEGTSKRLEKTRILAGALRAAGDDLGRVTLLLQGHIFPAWDKRKIGVSTQIVLRALTRVTGSPTARLEKAWSEHGDLGLVAEKHITGKTQQTLFSSDLTVEYVHEQLQRLAGVTGKGSVDTKLKIISELLSHASPQEARYITRTVLETLRIGIASGTLRDAIVWAFLEEDAGLQGDLEADPESRIGDRDRYTAVVAQVQTAYDKTNDFSQVALAARRGLSAVAEVEMRVGTPIKVMLGIRGESMGDAMAALGTPLLLQYKYDGFRVEIHKDGREVIIYTRRLEDVTEQFPDIVERVRTHIAADTCILDGEAIGVDPETGKYRPFQDVSQRIRRKHGIEEMAERLPVDTRIFDILLLDGRDLLDEPLSERHRLLSEAVEEDRLFGIAHTLITADPEEAQGFYDAALAAGEEGLFAKKLDSTYRPGTRVGNWIKLKTTMEPLDVVVIGAEWGEGKRSGWLTSYAIAITDEEGELREIGRVATGLKELEEQGFSFGEMTELLRPLIEHEEGRQVAVKPEIVLEVAYEEIQKSPSYSSGYALRFPRVLRNRTDERGPEDATTLRYVEELYAQQEKRG